MSWLIQSDPEVHGAISEEIRREQEKLILIASENYVSRPILEAVGSVMTNKYAEGYPGRRYYAGCEAVDQVETLAIERAKSLFGAEHANVQPHSGSQANMAVYLASINPGDTILGMNLAHGGHLTHGSPVSFSGHYYKAVFYGVRKETGLIDYDQVESLARQHKPKIIIAGASAYPRIIDFSFSEKLPMRLAPIFLWTWRILRVSWQPECTLPLSLRRLRHDLHTQDTPRTTRGNGLLQGTVGKTP